MPLLWAHTCGARSVNPTGAEVSDLYDEADDDSSDYESGPFCIHWGEAVDCDELCMCGHSCNSHDGGYEGCGQCDCEEWREVAQL